MPACSTARAVLPVRPPTSVSCVRGPGPGPCATRQSRRLTRPARHNLRSSSMGKRKDQKLARLRRQRARMILFSGVVIIVLGAAGYLLLSAFARPALQPMAGNVIDIAADMAGFDKPEVHVPVGIPVTIRLTSLDNSHHTDGGGKHQWAVDELGVSIIAPPEGVSYATFTPTEPGEFVFYCDVCCGGRANPTMQGKLVVEARCDKHSYPPRGGPRVSHRPGAWGGCPHRAVAPERTERLDAGIPADDHITYRARGRCRRRDQSVRFHGTAAFHHRATDDDAIRLAEYIRRQGSPTRDGIDLHRGGVPHLPGIGRGNLDVARHFHATASPRPPWRPVRCPPGSVDAEGLLPTRSRLATPGSGEGQSGRPSLRPDGHGPGSCTGWLLDRSVHSPVQWCGLSGRSQPVGPAADGSARLRLPRVEQRGLRCSLDRDPGRRFGSTDLESTGPLEPAPQGMGAPGDGRRGRGYGLDHPGDGVSAHATQLPRGADELLNRLLTAQGHLQAVSVMVAEAAPPEDILHQLCAVQAAISAAGRLILLRELRAGADAMLQSH